MLGEQVLISTVFIAGLLSFFAPCTFPLIPVYIGLLTDENREYKRLRIGRYEINLGAIVKTMTFVLGLSTTFVILGFGAGALGRLINNDWILVVGGLLVILLGIHQMELIKLPGLSKYRVLRMKNKKTKALGTYLMGVTFSLGWTPCVGPVLGAVLLTSASAGQAYYGGFLMLIYAFGLMIPFLVMATLSSLVLTQFARLEKHLLTVKRIGGGLIILMGILLMTNKLTAISIFFERLFN
ncbi:MULTISPECIES: cytochrome c biogenesis CcdA family protein [unclassified Fusibacter]|uniref:cytochrome c biogenesis CcdA family protein n=1 Tax=unclassified Fusibacter TaxID=2624464 RepID=UPI0010135DDF|nr:MULTISPECIES: cytochrome c biogenesis protein CcdA [unclassified Fusibacter]MCK8059091.1 cytochrome c biogenesis protein CcdA [Fusibacter sp. A2]NPE22500.1 cytochrome C biogenesis protein [Fusibacter sp. A1]RXV60603.1 cytochrome C biogenesis protein [Fusibacter sp. A1]